MSEAAPIAYFDPSERRREKQASRERDMAEIKSGHSSLLEIGQRNDFFASLDVSKFRLVAIGSRRLGAK